MELEWKLNGKYLTEKKKIDMEWTMKWKYNGKKYEKSRGKINR